MSVRKLSFTVVQPVITSMVVEENRKQKYCRLRPKKNLLKPSIIWDCLSSCTDISLKGKVFKWTECNGSNK